MHLKTRIFRWLDGGKAGATPRELAMSGSFNPEVGPAPEHGFLNNDTLVSCSLPRIVARYQAKYDAVLANTQVVNEWQDDEPVTQPHCACEREHGSAIRKE